MNSLLLGGRDNSHTYLKEILEYNTSNQQMETVGQIEFGRQNHVLALCKV